MEFPHIFWSPCAAHCINNTLKDIGDLPVHKATIEKAKTVTKFIYAHSLVLCMMRSFTKGKELTRPGITRFATNYLTLKSILEAKKSLKDMFTSKEWKTCKFFRQRAAINVEHYVLDNNFWKSVKYCLKCV